MGREGEGQLEQELEDAQTLPQAQTPEGYRKPLNRQTQRGRSILGVVFIFDNFIKV